MPQIYLATSERFAQKNIKHQPQTTIHNCTMSKTPMDENGDRQEHHTQQTFATAHGDASKQIVREECYQWQWFTKPRKSDKRRQHIGEFGPTSVETMHGFRFQTSTSGGRFSQ